MWGLAASLYNMLTGQLPRDFPEGMDPWWVILETVAVPILTRNPNIPTRLAKVIDQALVEEPQMTFPNAPAFREALEGAL